MKDLVITVNANTRKATYSKNFIGIKGENLQSNIIFDFEDEFIDGIGYLEIDNGEKYLIPINKTAERYYLPIKSSLLTKTGALKVQLRVNQVIDEDTVGVFKSIIIDIPVLEAVNATTDIPDEYPTWLEQADAKLIEVGEAIGDAETATENANTATENANTATTRANTASAQMEGLLDSIDTTPTQNSTDLVTSGGVWTYGEAIRAVAEGKNKSYVISYADNASFNSQADSLSGITSIVDVSGNTIQTSTLKNGDVVIVTELEVPDRWWSESDSKFYKLETSKVDLTGYATTQALNDGLADKLDAPETAGSQGDVLTLGSGGIPEWTTPSGGGGLTLELLYSTATAIPKDSSTEVTVNFSLTAGDKILVICGTSTNYRQGYWAEAGTNPASISDPTKNGIIKLPLLIAEPDYGRTYLQHLTIRHYANNLSQIVITGGKLLSMSASGGNFATNTNYTNYIYKIYRLK